MKNEEEYVPLYIDCEINFISRSNMLLQWIEDEVIEQNLIENKKKMDELIRAGLTLDLSDVTQVLYFLATSL